MDGSENEVANMDSGSGKKMLRGRGPSWSFFGISRTLGDMGDECATAISPEGIRELLLMLTKDGGGCDGFI